MLLDILPRVLYDASDIKIYAQDAGLSIWKINWNQSAIHIWNDLIQVASAEHKTLDLLNAIHRYYSGNTDILRLWEEVSRWESTLK